MPRVGFEPTIPLFERQDISCLIPRVHCERLFKVLAIIYSDTAMGTNHILMDNQYIY
jgi:hypothetical protein